MKTYFEDLIERLKSIDKDLEEYSLGEEADAHEIALDLRKSLNDDIDDWTKNVLPVKPGEELDPNAGQNVTVKDFAGEVVLSHKRKVSKMSKDKRAAEIRRLAQEQKEDMQLENDMMKSFDSDGLGDGLENELDEGGISIDKEDVLDFFRENNDPSDEAVHAFAEELGYDASELEMTIYELVTEYVKILDEDEDAEFDMGSGEDDFEEFE